MKKISLFLVLIGCSLAAFAQEDSTHVRKPILQNKLFWFGTGWGGYGSANDSENFGFSFTLDANLINKSLQYKLVYKANEELELSTTSIPSNQIHELGGLVGPFYHSHNFHIAAIAGVGLIYARNRAESLFSSGGANSEYTSVPEFGIGIPLRAEVDLIASDNISFGLALFSSINTASSFNGIEFRISVGRLR